jgi:ketosteroid isomerase-like protein
VAAGEARSVGLAFLETIVGGDLARIDALLHPDCKWWVQGWGILDRQALLAGLGRTIGRAASRSMRVVRSTAEDDRVAIVAEGAFVFAEGVYRNSYHYLFTVSDGRILDGREYLDTLVAARFYPAVGAAGE